MRLCGGTGQGRPAFVERFFSEESGEPDGLPLPSSFLVVTSVSGPARAESPSRASEPVLHKVAIAVGAQVETVLF